ncbi:MAG: ATP-binding protein [Chitinophagaceae bacterium]
MSTHELTRVSLENEMDLILAHKRSMRVAELCGLSLSAQTTLATAVSEVSRMSIESGRKSYLSLGLDLQKRDNYIVASLRLQDIKEKTGSGLEYAKRLVAKYNVSVKGNETIIELFYYFVPSFRITTEIIDQWRNIFRNEPAISPYEEIKRKNELLQELSEKVLKSETAYRTLTNSLPLFIFTLSPEGDLLFANEWLTRYTGETIASLNQNRWKKVVHEEDYPAFRLLTGTTLGNALSVVTIQLRLRNAASQEFLWHQITISPQHNDIHELTSWTGYIADIHAQKLHEETLRDNAALKEIQVELNSKKDELETLVADLNRSNHELQQFAFVASHDLQEPVRKLLYYSEILQREYGEGFDRKATNFLTGMNTSARRMRSLVQDLLIFSQINKNEVSYTNVDLNTLLQETEQDFELLIKEKVATIHRNILPVIQADERMIRQLFENLVSNSLKYSKKDEASVIEVSAVKGSDAVTIAIKDNGIGFDEKYLPNMFHLFQRLHGRDEYEGTGMGLAICKKIVDIHHGRLWAKSKVNQGAEFFIELPMK